MWPIALIMTSQFFDKPAVDFWGTRRPPQEETQAWAEPGHLVPPPVARLLERPTRENARAYLKWQEDRMARLRSALKAVDEARQEEKKPEVLYFTQDDCPFCEKQERELASADLRGRTVKRLTPKDEPELWSRHRVTVTPTLVIDGKALRGLQTRGQIEKEARP